MDQKIEQAIKESVSENNQNDSLSSQLAAWFKAIALGNEDINNKQSAFRHLELMYDEVKLPEKGLREQEI